MICEVKNFDMVEKSQKHVQSGVKKNHFILSVKKIFSF